MRTVSGGWMMQHLEPNNIPIAMPLIIKTSWAQETRKEILEDCSSMYNTDAYRLRDAFLPSNWNYLWLCLCCVLSLAMTDLRWQNISHSHSANRPTDRCRHLHSLLGASHDTEKCCARAWRQAANDAVWQCWRQQCCPLSPGCHHPWAEQWQWRPVLETRGWQWAVSSSGGSSVSTG